MSKDNKETKEQCDIHVVTRSLLIEQIEKSFSWFGVNMDVYELEEIEYSEGGGRITWLHKENDKTLPYAERRLQCDGFIYDEATGKILQHNNPMLT